jgi:hypothetical protein
MVPVDYGAGTSIPVQPHNDVVLGFGVIPDGMVMPPLRNNSDVNSALTQSSHGVVSSVRGAVSPQT